MSSSFGKVFLSSPWANEVQKEGANRIQKIVSDGGYELSGDVFSQNSQDRLTALKASDIVVAWMDSLLPDGSAVFHIGGIANEIEVGFPPDLQVIIDAGFHATKQGQVSARDRKAILLPGEVEKVANSPKSLKIRTPPNSGVVSLLSPPLNFPDATVLSEVAFSQVHEKPVIALVFGNPIVGLHVKENPLIVPVPSLEVLAIAMQACRGLKGKEVIQAVVSVIPKASDVNQTTTE